ncbi:hypothetical protein LguiB_001423 [Lonicera macranthoides]
MAAISYLIILITVFAIDIPRVTGQEINCRDLNSLNRHAFPNCFTFGVASSAFQGEGANKEGGRDKIVDISNGRMADSYKRYKEDVAILKDLGVDSYRLSLSWSRILPSIEASVTLFHWDLPQVLHDKYGGWLSPKIVISSILIQSDFRGVRDDFVQYADLCFTRFADRVKYWTTLNEPLTYSNQGYATGVMAPGRCSNRTLCSVGNSGTEPYLVTHNMLLAHAAVVKLFREKYQMCHNSKIGIVLNTGWLEPMTDSPADKQAAERQLDFNLGWHLNPVTCGEYPKSMQEFVKDRLPKFTPEESNLLKNSFDFIGLNYYSGAYAQDASTKPKNGDLDYNTDPMVTVTAKRNGKDIGEVAASSWLYVYPKGIYDLLMYVKDKYCNPLVIVTENGVDEVNDPKLTLQQARSDPKRIEYLQDHLCMLLKAIKDGCYIQGYYEWSLFDNFEWADGETVRFGIYYVDFVNGSQRYPKDSAIWYKKFLNPTTKRQFIA